ncbi:PDZ and LIM domain protein 3 isoform X5 [Zerene cesonia]|uniref:PDZ and LIM domain protein 3 isoform X5 n=1 Tax=Zerene cesonia TaxID=33412 RepID=UPI0018E54AFE|nr:PDZ and LIM domain protein 3 isoform X5 [Zerene cesonia]
MGRLHTFVVTLRRETRDTNWGLRLVGGSDLATPLIVTRVTPGTPAGRDLARGDIIAKIDDYDARDLRHEDAQNLFKNAQNQIKLVVQRTPSPKAGQGNAWRGPESLPRSTPLLQPQLSVQHEGEYRSIMLSPVSSRNDDVVDESIGSQPYRTTPLVLPGAKVRREPGPTESYLRHHPNPAMRAPPHHDYRDTLMKQKVAESVLQRVVGEEANKVVHKQFNSPINLYSEQNIANSIRQQTSPLPSKAFDPAKSDTFRALQEQAPPAHELPSPQTKLFTQPAKKPVPPKSKQQHEAKLAGKQTTFVNSLHEEHIQQSNSFKRLMYNVLGDTEF